MAEIRVEQKRGGAGRMILLILLLLALAAAAYWFFVMNGGSVERAETAPATSGALVDPALSPLPALAAFVAPAWRRAALT
jgi:flagellar basal body-associated protein FliL